MASAVATTTKKMITLESSGGKKFEVEEAVAMLSQTIRHVIEDVGAENAIPLPKVTSKILSKVIKYCKKHVDAVSEDDLKAWDAEFVKVDQTTLFGLVLAADYLYIKGLLGLTCQTVANTIDWKFSEKIHKIFNSKEEIVIRNFTPEEKMIRQIRTISRSLMIRVISGNRRIRMEEEKKERLRREEEEERLRREEERLLDHMFW